MLVAGSAAGSFGGAPPAASPFDDMAAASLKTWFPKAIKSIVGQ